MCKGFPRHRPATRAAALASALAVCILSAAASGPAAAADSAIEAFVGELRALCETPPARRCTGTVHGFLDLDGNGAIAPDELEAMRAAATAAVKVRESAMTAEERSLMGIALLGLQYAGPDAVFANFDADADGGLSHDELFADFRLDERSFAAVVEDRDSVDWNSFANRFGKVGKAFVAMLPGVGEK